MLRRAFAKHDAGLEVYRRAANAYLRGLDPEGEENVRAYSHAIAALDAVVRRLPVERRVDRRRGRAIRGDEDCALAESGRRHLSGHRLAVLIQSRLGPYPDLRDQHRRGAGAAIEQNVTPRFCEALVAMSIATWHRPTAARFGRVGGL